MNDAIHFREGVDGDRDAVLELRRQAFPESSPDMATGKFWSWKFRGGYAGPASFFVAEAGGQLVGHLALVPQRYAGPQSFMGGLTVDAMTHPKYRGRHIYSRLVAMAGERLRSTFQVFTAFQIRPHVLSGAVAAGWFAREHVPVLLKPLSLTGIARVIGLPFGAPLPQRDADGAADDAIRKVREHELAQIEGLAATPSIHQPRTVDFLRWRYLENPTWHYDMHGFFEGDRLQAFVVHRQTLLRGIPVLAFVDGGFRHTRAASFRRLVRHVLRQGRRRKLPLAAALLTKHHPLHRVLLRRGFLPGPHRFRFLLHVPGGADRWTRQTEWSLSWGDTDHL